MQLTEPVRQYAAKPTTGCQDFTADKMSLSRVLPHGIGRLQDYTERSICTLRPWWTEPFADVDCVCPTRASSLLVVPVFES